MILWEPGYVVSGLEIEPVKPKRKQKSVTYGQYQTTTIIKLLWNLTNKEKRFETFNLNFGQSTVQ